MKPGEILHMKMFVTSRISTCKFNFKSNIMRKFNMPKIYSSKVLLRHTHEDKSKEIFGQSKFPMSFYPLKSSSRQFSIGSHFSCSDKSDSAKLMETLLNTAKKLKPLQKDMNNEEESLQRQQTINSRLIAFMDKWEIKKAEKLLRQSIENGILPNPAVVVNLIQLIGNLGDFECLLSLREILMDNKFCSNERFFHCLQNAYFNSGRVEEAVLLLRILYHDIRKYNEVDVFFTLICVMILVHFPHRIDLIENFAKDCREKEPPDYLPTAGLWKCLMLTNNFERALMLKLDHVKVQDHLVKMMAEILSQKNNVQVDRICTLKYLSQNSAEYKGSIQSIIYSELVSELVLKRRWDELLFHLTEMTEKQIKFRDIRKVQHYKSKAEDILFNEDLDNLKLMLCIDMLKTLCDE